jgi:Tol biopolymer transport system component
MKARILTVLVALLLGARLDAQQYFGMNQVQYKHFDWRVIETEHWQVHYYPEERAGAMDAARMAERSYARLSRVLDHQFREKKPIILFSSRSEFGQNNITGDLGEGTGGATEPLRHRMVFPMTGDLGSFEHVLTHEMVHEFQFDIFARGKAGANLQTLNQIDPPLWFMEGMAEYLSSGPNHILTEQWVRDAVVNGNLPTIEQMTERPDQYFPYRFGESLWEYVGARWGDAAIGEILQNATTLGIARAFQRQLGLTLHELSDDWREAMNAKYLPQAASLDRPRTFSQPLLTEKKSGGQIFLAPALSSDGNRIAFLSNGSFKRGEVFIDLWLADARTGKRIKRLVQSTTNPNFEELRLLYSQSSFSNDGRTLAFTGERQGKDVLYLMDVASASIKKRVDLPIDAVWSPVFSPDDRQIAFSGTHGGITDLYIVDADGKNLRQLTNDQYADLQPSWSPDGRRIAFATDRSPESNLAILKLSKWRIAVMDIQSGAIDVLPGQDGLNLNPQWSPDGSEVAFISDRTGIPNVFLYDFATRNHYQLTNVLGGVGAITEYSPAISWARASDRMAFTYYEKGDYTVWTVENPRGLKRAAFRPGANNAAVAMAAVDSEKAADSAALRLRPGEPTSTYRAPGGSRQSSVLPAQEMVAELPPTIGVLMADPVYGLPDTTRFKEHPYHVSFHPDYIADPSVGYTPSYGGMFAGGTAFVFSDLLGNHQLAVAGNVYGRLSDASAFVGYANLSHRLQYTTGVAQEPIYVPITGGVFNPGNPPNPNVVRFQTTYLRYVIRNVFLSGQYPFNRFTRVETGLQFNSIGQGVINVFQDCNQAGYCTDVQFHDSTSIPTLNYVTPSSAFVSDNTLFGTTGPIMGRRMRFQVSQSVGNVRFTDFLADYRRYDPIIFNTLTIATRFLSSVSVGRDERFFPKYIGRPDFVRGYDRANFSFVDCTSVLNSQTACNNAQLAGSRVAVFNEELRFPIIRRFDIGSSFGLPPVDGLFFYDAGLAWSSGQTPHLGSAPKGNDPNFDRYPLTSWGAGLRVNLFNLAILRWDYARPMVGHRKPNWTFSLGASY